MAEAAAFKSCRRKAPGGVPSGLWERRQRSRAENAPVLEGPLRSSPRRHPLLSRTSACCLLLARGRRQQGAPARAPTMSQSVSHIACDAWRQEGRALRGARAASGHLNVTSTRCACAAAPRCPAKAAGYSHTILPPRHGGAHLAGAQATGAGRAARGHGGHVWTVKLPARLRKASAAYCTTRAATSSGTFARPHHPARSPARARVAPLAIHRIAEIRLRSFEARPQGPRLACQSSLRGRSRIHTCTEDGCGAASAACPKT